MPIAELLGVQVDMQLLLKLSVSVATVLLVSWAFRFWNYRNSTRRHLYVSDSSDKHAEEPPDKKRQNRSVTPSAAVADNEDKQTGRSRTDPATAENPKSDGVGEQPDDPVGEHRPQNTDSTPSLADPERKINVEGAGLSQMKQVDVAPGDILLGSALNRPGGRGAFGLDSRTGRRSPRLLQRTEHCVGVGRELRQDLQRHRASSSFHSKAEITVEDASLVLGGMGDRVVRRKIYDYYVESSSHSITDSKPVFGHYERISSDSEPAEFESRGNSLAEARSSLSPVIMRDLDLPKRSVAPVIPEPGPPAKPVLLRKESYLSATEHCKLPVPSPAADASRSSHCEEPASASPRTSSSALNTTDRTGLRLWEEPGLESLAGPRFLHLSAKILNSAVLEGLKSKLDLGNCIEVLVLAKKHGQASLQLAALRVMSDNYLQVLREPSLHGRLLADELVQIQRQRMKGRRLVVAADMDPQDWARHTEGHLAETEERKTSSSLYYYDNYKDAWKRLCPIPKEVISKGCAMCTMDNYLFVAVGCQGTEREMIPSKRVFCFNPVTSIWKEISPMNEARPHCKLESLQGYLYAIGGECLSTVERYDPRADRWTFVAPLPNDTFAVAHRATVCNGEIFVSGGSLRYTLLRYSPKTDTWRPSVIVGSRDRTTDMVAVGNFLYRFEVSPRLGISVYRYHTVARLWYECGSKRLSRASSFQCVVLEDSIFCVSRHFTVKFKADEISPAFVAEDMSVLSAAKGVLFPFVLSFPDKEPVQTCV